MQKHDLIRWNKTILRILAVHENKVLVMDCLKRNMPQWVDIASIAGSEPCTELELSEEANMELVELELLDPATRKIVHERFTIIAGILPFVADDKMRSVLIARIAEEHDICKQTIRNYLCLYLAFQNLSALAPKQRSEDKPLSKDEKNMRWALNRFFYTKNRNSLTTAYTLMLKERYTDSSGSLLPEYPTFNQFRYFYRKHRKMQTYLISRNGLKDYQRNNRPLLGNGVQSFAPAIGVAMLDSTICDIYLVDEAGNLVGRPILTACVDAFSGLCCGYSLSWEGGVYSLRGLMECVIADKVELCRKHGIAIKSDDWNCNQLPATLVTDMGSEYKSANFEQIAELGVKVVNLPAYRPELKGSVEKFFDLIQSLYKPTLKGKGIIEPNYQERGAHDYRKDACITLDSFETILLHCILYYNCQRIIENFPYTEEMLSANIPPHASDIWNWSMGRPGANLIAVSPDELLMALMPRATGTFTRLGLKVNQLRYARDGYTEAYLSGGSVTVAYNPDDVSCVWLLEKGSYIPFYLIETRFNGMSLEAVEAMQTAQKGIVKDAVKDNLQARIDLCMVGTPESARFFEQAMQLARRSLGIQYGKLEYDAYFADFCKVLFRYQYVKNPATLTDGIIHWLYEHSSGIISNVVSLVHDAQEIAILSGKEALDLETLNEAYHNRLSLLHGFIEPSITATPKATTAKAATAIKLQESMTVDHPNLISELAALASVYSR